MKKYFKMINFYIYEILYLVIIECFNQYLIRTTIEINIDNIKTAVIFDIIWTLIFVIILYIIKPKLRKIIATIFNIFILTISIGNYFMYSYFSNIISFKDIFLAGDGVSFINSIYKFINLKLILFVLVCIDMIVLILKTKTKYYYKIKSLQSIIIVVILSLLITSKVITKNKYLSNTSDGWDSSSVLNNNANYYNNWIDPVRLLRINGTYEYLTRDFYISFLKKDNAISAYNEVTSYINNYKLEKEESNYNGIFKGKNVIYVMMESMDDYLVNDKVTPTMYKMMQHGFNFTNHYSPGYVTGDTANTEFIANTGIYPNINKLSPNYAYVDNSYPFSIANLFKNNGYITNSFHRSFGFIYNRSEMHISLGYNNYHNYSDMGISDENLDLDTYIIKDGYDKIINNERFFSFIITYSPHSPYTYDKIECQSNLTEIKEIYSLLEDEELLCSYSAARETDNMFKLLLENLEKDKLLDDTIIVAFSDHPNHLLVREDETELLNKTIFFIYDKNMDKNEINTITSSINILPTVINLFGIETNYIYPGYDALNYNNGYVIFKDYTYYDGKNINNLTKEMYDDIKYSANLLVSNYYK